MSVRFVMIGGFLGAGKTTSLSRLARMYQARGQKVGLVTNDQAHDLVDTNNLRAQGFDVAEVPGACFCCRFSDLVDRVGQLEAGQRPDVILAEPVGSCTDLVATVIQPLKDLYSGRFSVAPYPVLFKPSHGLKILKQQPAGGFSPKAAYIFSKQLEEADAIVINRVDELSPESLSELTKLLEEQYPGTTVLKTSATQGLGFDALLEFLDQEGAFGRKILDIDYDIYAEGEAELGWLNTNMHLSASKPFELDSLIMSIMKQLTQSLEQIGGEVAHLKVIGQDDGGAFGVANLVSTDGTPVLSLPSACRTLTADLTVNARVAIDPVILESEVRRIVVQQTIAQDIEVKFRNSQSLRPGRPVPTHRYAAAKN